MEIWLSCGNRDQLGNCDDLPLDHEKEKILVTSILCVTFSRKDAESSKPFQAYCFSACQRTSPAAGFFWYNREKGD